MNGDFVYDVETYPNAFTLCIKPLGAPSGYFYEISDRRDDTAAIRLALCFVRRMIGYNNMGFDWPVLDFILTRHRNATPREIYDHAMAIISGNRFDWIIWRPSIVQIDLYMIHHFDNPAKATSLKRLEFTMRLRSVKDLPFPVGTHLTSEQIDTVINYNGDDVLATERFALISAPDIAYRETLGPEWINYNDTKIGKKFFEQKLNDAGIKTREFGKPIQTLRPDGVSLAGVIFPFIEFHTGPFREALEWFRGLTIKDTKGKHNRKFKLPCGFEISLGMGGIHGSIEASIVQGDNIADWDVEAYYPSVGIVHRIRPEQYSEEFCDIWGNLKKERKKFAKGTSENKTLKLSCNGVFGDMNNEHSCFLDVKAMLAITVNGQLMLCMLAEALSMIPNVRLIQVNTDGVTLQFPDSARYYVDCVFRWWQGVTGMDLEAADYNRMFIRDVNNYIGEYVGGKQKRKGAYEFEREWHKNHSAMVVPRAVQAYLIEDVDIEDFIRTHADPWDFLLCTKVPRSSSLWAGERQLQNVTRYYISETGDSLTKLMPPVKRRKKGELVDSGPRRIGVHAEGLATAIGVRNAYRCSICGDPFSIKATFEEHNAALHAWKIREVNEFDGTMPADIDYRYYIREAEKLLIANKRSENGAK